MTRGRTGRRRLETKKSQLSRTPLLPNIVTPLRRLFSRAHGMDRIRRPIKLMTTLFFLDHPKLSIKDAMIFSNTAMMVHSAAKNRNSNNCTESGK